MGFFRGAVGRRNALKHLDRDIFNHCARLNAPRPYGLTLGHKHVPEMRRHAGLAHSPVFAPSVARAFRGMVVEVQLPLAVLPSRPSRAALLDTLHAAFAGQPLIRVHDEAPAELLWANMMLHWIDDRPALLRVTPEASAAIARLVRS